MDLSDSAAREGLVESESFFDLKNLVLASIKVLETHRANTFQESREAKKPSASKEAEQIQTQLFSVNFSTGQDHYQKTGKTVTIKKIEA